MRRCKEDLIEVTRITFGPEVEQLVLGVLRSGHIAQGPMVERFESLCAEMSGCAHAVAVSNGTASLEAALEVMGVGRGDEVITTPFTFAATINPVLRSGATVRFADITADYTIDPDAAASLIGPHTAAIVPVHLYGLMADMPAIAELARRQGLLILEDAAQAHGASIAGRKAGSFGCGSFSFYASKNVTAGEGGALTTSDADLARRLRLLRNQGMSSRYYYEMVGRNMRMTDLQAAVALPQLLTLHEANAARMSNALRLSTLLREEPSIELPVVPVGRVHVWHQYTILLPNDTDRDAVVSYLRQAGVGARVHYPRPLSDYDVYRSHPRVIGTDKVPVAADVAARCLSLPVRQGLSEAELEGIASATISAVRSRRGPARSRRWRAARQPRSSV
jgi:dTDP-4-amino-4,6-dideoxygalactose transaminase